jgi:hypothetical protein
MDITRGDYGEPWKLHLSDQHNDIHLRDGTSFRGRPDLVAKVQGRTRRPPWRAATSSGRWPSR